MRALSAVLMLGGILALGYGIRLSRVDTRHGTTSLEFLNHNGVTQNDVARFYSSICTNRILERVFMSALDEAHCARQLMSNELLRSDKASVFPEDYEELLSNLTQSHMASNFGTICKVDISDLVEFKKQYHVFMPPGEFDEYFKSHDFSEEITNDIINAHLGFELVNIVKLSNLFPAGESPALTTISERYAMLGEYCANMSGSYARLVVWLFFNMLDQADPSHELSREAWKAFKDVMASREGSP